jgi:hypothetical protein
VADSATGSLLIRYPDLSRAIGADISFAGRSADGTARIKASRTVSTLGRSVTGTVSAGIVVSGPASLGFTAPQVDVGGVAVPTAVIDSLNSTFDSPVTFAGLPSGLHLTAVRVDAQGILVSVAGRGVNLGGS